METASKVLIMLVRMIALAAIILGFLVWWGRGVTMVNAHIGIGFLMMLALFSLGVIAMLRRVFALGALGVIVAALIPVIGFMQFPLRFREFGMIQIIHIVVVLGSIGIAEAINGAVQRKA